MELPTSHGVGINKMNDRGRGEIDNSPRVRIAYVLGESLDEPRTKCDPDEWEFIYLTIRKRSFIFFLPR